MKRIVLASALLTGSLHAEGLYDAVNQLSEYRAVSGIKAVGAGIGAIQTANTAWVFGKVMMAHLQDQRPLCAINKDCYNKWTDTIGCGAAVFGLLYATTKLGWEWFPKYARHALKI